MRLGEKSIQILLFYLSPFFFSLSHSFFLKKMSFILSSHRFFVNRPVLVRSFQSCRTQLRDYVEPVVSRAPLEGIRVLDLTRVLGKQYSRSFFLNKKQTKLK